MGDEIEWYPDDGDYSDETTDALPLSTALYDVECVECGNGLTWKLDADPDGPRWYDTCCGQRYSIYVESVVVSHYEAGL